MEANMAHVVHHHPVEHHREALELWAAGIVFALLASVAIYFSMTTGTDVASMSTSLPEPPTAPLIW
jgi:hypothetical protein